MGWYFQHREPGISDRRFFTNLLGAKSEMLDCASKNRTEFYAAVRNTESGEVWAFVCMMQWVRSDYNFGYKPMDDTMGPNIDNCPARILDLLTPTDSEWSNDWRARCRAKANRPKVKAGDTVVFAHPFSFTNGDEADTFTYVKGSRFVGTNGTLYHIRSWRQRQYTVSQ